MSKSITILSSNARNYGIRYRIRDGANAVFVYGYNHGSIYCTSCGDTKAPCIHAKLARSDKRFIAAHKAFRTKHGGR